MTDHSAPLEAPPPYSETRNAQLETPSPSLAARSPRESLSPEPEPLPDRKLPLPVPAALTATSESHQSSTQPVLVDFEDDKKHDTDDPPEDAQRARAPLLVTKSNSSIKGDWLLFTEKHTNSKDVADARLQTTNSSISAALWASDSDWKAPVTVEFKTTNSSIGAAVHTQTFDELNLGRNEVLLPADFHGILKMSTSNSKCTLSDSLRRRSVRVPNGPDESKSQAEWYEIGPPGGASVAEVRTSNSRVSVGLVGDKVDADLMGSGTGRGSCVVS